MRSLSVTLTDSELAIALDGRTFQIYAQPGGVLVLYPVVILPLVQTCPVVIGGERCIHEAGHAGKHSWARGDLP